MKLKTIVLTGCLSTILYAAIGAVFLRYNINPVLFPAIHVEEGTNENRKVVVGSNRSEVVSRLYGGENPSCVVVFSVHIPAKVDQ
ncbi:hypothetical protein D5018_20530 [Parashewanella curva]|uniref:Uncharacterized protein n=1 Tax=Parashewanella curva TaxID=2338552 RepID=A0A3L8PUU7_9GAMM|nr:hypothetical protein [Parashewanella curva]RLV57812.1 hypothetical protein D5018_20530 [Parashewanella curva]